MTDHEKWHWTDVHGIERHISELDDDHLKNVFGVLSKRREKTMQYFNVLKELKKRGLK